MNVKHKLLAVLLMSTIVFVGGGYALYNLYTAPSDGKEVFYFFTSESGKSGESLIVKPVETPSMGGRKVNNLKASQSSDAMPTILADNDMNQLAKSGSRSFSTNNERSHATASSFREREKVFSATTGLIAASGSAAAGKSRSSNAGSYTSGSGIGGTMVAAPPFSGGSGSSGDGVLVDPEPGTLDESTQILPVGPGAIFLSMIALLYGVLLWVRSKE